MPSSTSAALPAAEALVAVDDAGVDEDEDEDEDEDDDDDEAPPPPPGDGW
jgi:hypothetical protein